MFCSHLLSTNKRINFHDIIFYMLLKETIKEIYLKTDYNPFNKGDLLAILVIPFFEKTKFLLSSKQKNVSLNKSRPIIIVNITNNETITLVAFTRNIILRRNRPKVSIKDCIIEKSLDECFGLNLKNNISWIFSKKTKKSKKLRFYYHVDVYILKQMLIENTLKRCGSCSEKVISEIENKINEFGEVL